MIFIFWIGIAGIKQAIVFENIDKLESVDNKIKIETTQKSKERDNYNYASVLKLIEQEKIFLQANLSLVDFSRRLSISPRYLSELIKRKSGKNFSQFVNNYRIEEAKTLLLSSEKDRITILGIAYDCGFSSKASFYKVFKEFTSLSPTEFIKNHTKD